MKEIKRICIVGGGVEGWMVASIIKNLLKDIDIVVIQESEYEDQKEISESTVQGFKEFFGFLRIDDDKWIKECNATYKIGNYIKNFQSQNDGGFFNPTCHSVFSNFNKALHFLYFLPKEYPQYYSSKELMFIFNPISFLGEKNKLLKGNFGTVTWDIEKDASYHFDKNLFKKMLKEQVAMLDGVAELSGKVVGFDQDKEGNITNLFTSEGIGVNSDLYIDCTGKKSLLLGQYMGTKFKSFKKYLLNNYRVSVSIPYKNKELELVNYTTHTALKNGWVQTIPLWDRLELNYFYSNEFISNKEALNEFKNYVKKEFSYLESPPLFKAHTEIKQGKHKKAWVKNVVAIGSSFGSLEPITSFDKFITVKNIIRLLGIISFRNGYSQIDQVRYNNETSDFFDLYRDYTSLIYHLSNRNDSEYWKYNTSSLKINKKPKNTSFQEFLNIPNMATFKDAFTKEQSLIAISSGMGHYPVNNIEYWFMKGLSTDNHKELKILHENYIKLKEDIDKSLEKELSTYQFLKQYIYNLDN